MQATKGEKATRPGRVARRLVLLSLAPIAFVILLLCAAHPASAAPLAGASANMDRVCTLAGATVADLTSAANDANANDVTVGDDTLNTGVDEVYYGMNSAFSTLYLNVGTSGTIGAVSWSYRGPSGWSALTVTDGTLGYVVSGTSTVTWTIPSDWTTYQVDASNCTGTRYYVKATTSVNYVTLPKLTQASAIPFNLKVKAQDELGTAFTGLASSAFTVTGGTTNTIFAFRETGSGTYELGLDTAGADVNFDLKAAKDGYVTSGASATGSLTTSRTDLSGSPLSLNFAFKVTGVSNELSTSLSGVTVKAGNLQGTTCTESGGAWYCAVPLADTTLTIYAAKDGYVTDTATSFGSDRTSATEAQVTASVTNVRFAAKITSVADELSTSLSSVTVTTGDSFGTSCTESGGAWYCALPLANTATDVKAAKDGYVTKTTLVAFLDRILDTDAQRTATVTGVQLAYKVAGVNTEASTSLTAVTVKAGNAQGTTCTESGGAWYCAVPLADTTLTIQAAKDGYVTNTASSFATDRTSATEAQVAASVTGVLFTAKFTITTESDLTGITWEKKIGAGAYASNSPTTTSGTVAYFAQTTGEANVVFRATKGSLVGDSGAAFTASATSQTARSVALVGTLASVATTPGSTPAAAATTYSFVFTLAHAWAADGRLVVTFPSGYSIASPTATLSGATGTATASVSGLLVTVTRANNGAQTAASTVVTVVISGVTNPSSAGTTGTFALSLQSAAATVLDTADAPAVSIGASVLTITGLASSTHAASVWVSSTSLLVTWSAPSDATVNGYSWAIDADPDTVVDGTSAQATVSVADGSHTFRVQARNAAGSWGPIASYGSILVDSVAPVAPTIQSGTHAASTCAAASTAAFTWSASDARSGLHATLPYAYALDGASATRTAASSVSLSVGDGTHTLTVWSYDQAGLSASASYTFRVDQTAPTVSLTAPANTNAATLSLAWSSTDACTSVSGVSIEQRINGGAWTSVPVTGASGTTTVSVSEGLVEFRARATDLVGNVGAFPTTAQASTTVDRTAPAAPGALDVAAGPRGTFRVTWTQASDDRSGVASYRVERVIGGQVVATATVTSLEYVDSPQADGVQARFRVAAADRAGNIGPSIESELRTADAQGPASAPGGLRFVEGTPAQLRWTAVEGAADYAIYLAVNSDLTLDASQLLGSTADLRYDVLPAIQGALRFAVVARDAAGNEGPAARVSQARDTLPPTVDLKVPAESSIAVPLAWHASDPGSGVAIVEIYVAQDGGAPQRYLATTQADGRASFFGHAGHTYRFLAVATDRGGRALALTDAPAHAVRVTDAPVRASAQAQRLLGFDGAGEAFYAEDRDGDGFPETLIDPSGRITALHVVPLESSRPAYLLGGSGGVPAALWDPATGEALPINLTTPIGSEAISGPTGVGLRVQVDKHAGWIYVPVPDAHPGLALEGVYRSDGSRLAEGSYWRVGDAIVFLDDPTTEYVIAYGSHARTPFASYALAVLGLLLVGFVAWVLGPRTDPDATRRAGLGWALRHCGVCGVGLPRLARLMRSRHECSLARRIEAKPSLSRRIWGQRSGRAQHSSGVPRIPKKSS